MWTHYCEAEKAWLSNLIGEPCNWCGCTETSGEARTGQWGHPTGYPQCWTNQKEKHHGDRSVAAIQPSIYR